MICNKVIVLSTGWIFRVLTVSSLVFSAATTKDDDYDQELHRCRRWRTALVRRKLLWYFPVDRKWSQFVLLCFSWSAPAKVSPSRPELKLNAQGFEIVIFIFAAHSFFRQPMKQFEFCGASGATRQRHFKTSSTGDENDRGWPQKLIENCIDLKIELKLKRGLSIFFWLAQPFKSPTRHLLLENWARL